VKAWCDRSIVKSRSTRFSGCEVVWKPGGVSEYTPPLTDILFVMESVAGLPDILAAEHFGHVDLGTVRDVLTEVGRFMAEVVAPTNRDGDTIGSQWRPDGSVVTPPSFKPAYAKWVE